jgi:hypothetical protein
MMVSLDSYGIAAGDAAGLRSLSAWELATEDIEITERKSLMAFLCVLCDLCG